MNDMITSADIKDLRVGFAKIKSIAIRRNVRFIKNHEDQLTAEAMQSDGIVVARGTMTREDGRAWSAAVPCMEAQTAGTKAQCAKFLLVTLIQARIAHHA